MSCNAVKFRNARGASLSHGGLTEGVIHLWAMPLDGGVRPPADRYTILSGSEREKASAFVFERHRNAYVASHVLLRCVLSLYVQRSPAEIAFTFGPQGKPALVEDGTSQKVEFNLSHCDRMAIVAVSRNRVGVDIERLRSMDACDAIARTTFSSSEYLAQARLPSDIRQRAFFQCWTRKEAVVKALGGGLSIPLDSFEVTVEPDVPARVVRFAGWTRPQWSLLHLAPTAEIIGAVAAPYEVRSVEATLLDG